MPSGTLVLLYHCTHYPLRGGTSSAGVDCGVFYINARTPASDTGWSRGAALSYDFILCLS